jgi:hypothetical protein
MARSQRRGSINPISLQIQRSTRLRIYAPYGLHKGLHTHRTLEIVQVQPNRKVALCRSFAEPSDGLEPSTPPPYHGGFALREGGRGTALATAVFLQLHRFVCQTHPSFQEPASP